MKKKKTLIAVVIILAFTVGAVVFVSSIPNWSNKTYEAVVQEIVTQSDGEIRLVVERTTEIYGDPMNSLGISDSTKLIGVDGKELSIDDFYPGDPVRVTLKDAFTEEIPFYYPTVYEIEKIETGK